MFITQERFIRMYKLALVGKNIQHSRSPEVYKKLLGESLEYHLLDYQSANEIPAALELFKSYDGISITSPYKQHFVGEVKLSAVAEKLGAINCLVKRADGIWGENTDYLAIHDILRRTKDQFKNLTVIILGSGVMSRVTELALQELHISYAIYSRKNNQQFDRINLAECFNKEFPAPSTPVIINACAREFVFTGTCPENALFWDYNYNFLPHTETIPKLVATYMDGFEMLNLQARFALAYWSAS
jgi:shikimate dehydrogenase